MHDFFDSFWSEPEVNVNLIILANIVGSLLLGMMVGYERTFRGRAAGMGTYGLVCMSSCALTVIVGYPDYWYGAHALNPLVTALSPDPTRVIQGVVTGIGFLGAGVIMRDGLNITGLTSAASIWSSSAIGVLVGLGFYAAAILLACLMVALMLGVTRIERILPSRQALLVVLRFKPGFRPDQNVLMRVASDRGYEVARESFHVSYSEQAFEWRYTAVAKDHRSCVTVSQLATELAAFPAVEKFEISHSRN